MLLCQDYRGQALSEFLFHVILVTFTAAGFLIGYTTQQMQNGVFTLLAGVIVASLVCLELYTLRLEHRHFQIIGFVTLFLDH